MAFAYKTAWFQNVCMTQSSGDRKQSSREATTGRDRLPAEQFAPLATTFSRRLLVGIGTASLVVVGADFGGITSFLLGLSPETSRNLKLDVVYPIGGYNRCIDSNEGFEFIYPVVAFGPPGTSGELNVSVIVSPVPLDFKIEAFGGPKEVGEALVQTITGSGKRPEVKGTLVESTLREDSTKNVKYYELEFKVESPSFRRHNVAVFCVRNGRLFTLNAQAPESMWPEVKPAFQTIAKSFTLPS